MSQIFKPMAATPPPPGFLETLTANDGTVVPPDGSDNINVLSAVVAAGTTPTRTIGNAGTHTLTTNIQISQAIAAADATKIGLSNFNSAQFTVDTNGFVGLKGSGTNPPILGVHPNATSGSGTDPTVADASGNISILGASVAAGTNPVRTVATAANSLTTQVQISQAIAATDATKIGLAAFNSAQFTVDANGFVSTSGTGVGQTITGQSGGALSPTAGNWNIFGDGATASGFSTAGNILTSGSGSTLTISPSQAQFMTNYTQVLIGASPYTALITDYYISCVSSGGAITIKLPNAPTTNRLFIIKDKSGAASTSNISITTVGGAVTIDGQTTYTIAGNYGAVQLLFNGTSYEVY